MDRRWIAFGDRAGVSRRIKLRRPIIIGLCGFQAYLGVLLVFAMMRGATGAVFIAFILCAATLGFTIFYSRGLQQILLIDGAGIFLYHSRTQSLMMPWDRVLEVRLDTGQWKVVIERIDQPTVVLSVFRHFGGFMPDVDRFDRIVNEERLAYYARIGQTPPTAAVEPPHKPGAPATLRFPIS